MEELLGIIAIIIAAVISSQKNKQKKQNRKEAGSRPVPGNLQTERALESSALQMVMPLEQMQGSAEEKMSETGLKEPKPLVEANLEPRVKQKIEVNVHEGDSFRTEAPPKEPVEIPAPEKPAEGGETKPQRSRTEIRETEEADIPGLDLNFSGDEMVKAVILSEVLNRRPNDRIRRYS